MRCRCLLLLGWLLFWNGLVGSALSAGEKEGSVSGLRAPDGFQITQFADSKLANDIYCLTIDPHGRLVASGRGYIRILCDDDNDGKAERAIDVADAPKDGAMGMLWEKDALYVTGEGGLRVFHDRDGDGQSDGPSKLIRAMKTGSEHAAHAIRRGPDGWLYVLCGNHAGIDKSYAELPTSPIKDPVAGCVLRFSPDLHRCEIVAHGFRNPYAMDFDADGELFTYDSDNERCVSLPWYAGTRLYHVIPGGHHGWLSPQRADTFRLPPYFIDVATPVVDLGRGSPTGLVCYRHSQFPAKYRNSFLLADWTFGKIYHVRSGKAETFIEATGDNGFAPTALVVQPTTGDLYIAVGGRGTRGAVYRVRYPAGIERRPGPQALPDRPLDWRPDTRAAILQEASTRKRIWALAYVHRHVEKFTQDELLKVIEANWTSAGPERFHAAQLLRTLEPRAQDELAQRAIGPHQHETALYAMHDRNPKELFERFIGSSDPAPWLRTLQLALGDVSPARVRGTVWEGYTARNDPDAILAPARKRQVVKMLLGLLPDREAMRLLAMLRPDDDVALASVARTLADAAPIEAIHRLIVFACVGGKRSDVQTSLVADVLVGLDARMQEGGLKRDSNWPLRMSELYTELAARDPELHRAVLRHRDFGRPAHALFARSAAFEKPEAARAFLKHATKDPEYSWNADLVQIVSQLPAQDAIPVLRSLWGKSGLESAILPVLARAPQAEDRGKFIDGLTSTSFATAGLCLKALETLPLTREPAETFALIRALGALPEKEKSLRNSFAKRLGQVSGQDFGIDKKAWSEWFAMQHPELAGKLNNPDGVDLNAWQQRIERIQWAAGNSDLGKQVFVRAQCATCHSNSQAVGPDLAGVGKRFARDDLLTALLQPSRDVSPQFQTTMVETTDGKIHQGRIVYQAVDSLILQTGAVETVRLQGDQVASLRPSPASLMPAGLLDKLTDRDIADLYAYLKSQ